MNCAALLLLADGRFPAGGYAHSGGLEEAIRGGRVTGLVDLDAFLTGRAATAGLVSAAFAAAACDAFAANAFDRLDTLDAELDARIPAPVLREASRTLGRQMRRAVNRIRPECRLDRLGRAPHQPLVLGAAAAVLDVGPHGAALAALYEAVTGPATAATRLLRIDPFDVHAVLGGLTGLLDEVAATAAGYAASDPAELPAAAAPLLDTSAGHHRRSKARLFAS